jgi:hypothetical protein
MTHFRAVLNRTRSHITGNAVAYLALFVALGGTSYGLASGSIDSREIKNNTVRTGDLRNNEVRSRDIRNRTIVGRDHLSNSLGGDQIDESELGKVPLAARAESADSALALGGEPATAYGRTLANTTDFDDGDGGTVLEVPGYGTLRAPDAPGCDTGAPDITLEWLNSTQFAQDSWTTVSGYSEIEAGDTSPTFVLSDNLRVRIGQQGAPTKQVTIDVFFAEVTGPSECRVSAQAVTSG